MQLLLTDPECVLKVRAILNPNLIQSVSLHCSLLYLQGQQNATSTPDSLWCILLSIIDIFACTSTLICLFTMVYSGGSTLSFFLHVCNNLALFLCFFSYQQDNRTASWWRCMWWFFPKNFTIKFSIRNMNMILFDLSEPTWLNIECPPLPSSPSCRVMWNWVRSWKAGKSNDD